MNKNQFNTVNKQHGLTLIEMMVALVLSLIIMGGVIQIFISNKATYRMNEAMSRVQENGRFATMFLTQDIRMAGFQGCGITGNLTNTLQTACSSTYCGVDDYSKGIQGFDNVTGSISVDASITFTPKSETDVVVVYSSADSGISLEKNNSGAQVFVTDTGTVSGGCPDGSDKISGLCDGDILLVSDCSKSRIFQTTGFTLASASACGSTSGGDCLNLQHAASGTPGNNPSSWGGSSAPESEQFGSDASLFKMATYYYYIASNSSGSPALFKREGRNTPQELVEGVENMQILYGEDTDAGDGDGVANQYVNAATVADWNKVVSVRISLLLQTIEDNVASEVINYNYNFITGNVPADKRLR
ncbi:MAG: PilW family protein, partial [Gammaproteobacteria bacterium]|nr:PilW family protein [Gammaproteobacteria bacterium]